MHYAERPLPIGGRGNVLIGALGATMLANLVAVAIYFHHLGVVNDLDRGKDLSFETVQASDILTWVGIGFQVLAFATAAVLFLVWFQRAYRNLPRLGVSPMRYDDGWEIGAWFIPVFNLIRPKQIVDDIWRGSEPRPGPKRLEDGPRVPAIIHLWWVAYCIAWLFVVASWVVGWEAQTLPAQRTAVELALYSCVAYLLAAALAMFAVRKISRRQDAAVAAALAVAPAGPVWGQPGGGWGQLGPAAGQPHPTGGGWGRPEAPAWGQPAPAPGQPAPAPPPAWGQPAPAPSWGQPPATGTSPPPLPEKPR